MDTTQTSSPSPVIDMYRRRARHYDLTANLYYLIGFRERAYRARAVAALELRAGDTVLELGCGTGLNFALLERAVGPSGRIIGVDLTDAMLDAARRRTARRGWHNVELVLADAAEYRASGPVDGVLSTLALSLSPRAGEIVAIAARALRPGGRLAVLDMKLPPAPLDRLAPLLVRLVRPFGVTAERVAARPWETIWCAMYRHLEDVRIDESFAGAVFLASGRRPEAATTVTTSSLRR